MRTMVDAFVMLPGGLGTWEEFLEAPRGLNWAFSRALWVMNVNGYSDPLVQLLASATEQTGLSNEHRDMIVGRAVPAAMVERLRTWVPSTVDKWITDRYLSPVDTASGPFGPFSRSGVHHAFN